MEIKFSLIIPCYNQSNFIRDCYLSIVAQKYNNLEIIFINDGSLDDTLSIIEKIAFYDSKVKIINKSNGGLASARNAGIKVATGDYVIYLDCDDMLLPNCLRSIKTKIENKASVDLIHFGYRHIIENGINVMKVVLPKKNCKLLPSILYNNLGPVHSFCVNKTLLKKIGFFDEKLKSCEDWDYWIRASFLTNKIYFIEIALSDYRVNQKSMSRNSFTLYDSLIEVAFRGKKLLLEKKHKVYISDKEFINSLKYKLALCLGISITQNKIEESIQLFKKETKKYSLLFNHNDFKIMSSYLTFRYRTETSELNLILNTYYPLFKLFFQKIGLSKINQKRALWVIFKKHFYLMYIEKYGYLGLIYCKIKSKVYK